MELAHEQIRRAMFEREDLVCGQLQIIDMGDYGRHGVPNLTSRLWSSLKLGAEFSQITDSNYPEPWSVVVLFSIARYEMGEVLSHQEVSSNWTPSIQGNCAKSVHHSPGLLHQHYMAIFYSASLAGSHASKTGALWAAGL